MVNCFTKILLVGKRFFLVSLFFFALIGISILLNSCRKKKEFEHETGIHANEYALTSAFIDAAFSDANAALSKNNLFGGRNAAVLTDTICGCAINATHIQQGIIILAYDNATDCNGVKRSGGIKITIADYTTGKKWKDVNAVMRLDFLDFKIVRASDNKTLLFEGTVTITNINGGNSGMLYSGQINSLVYKMEGSNIVVKVDDGERSTCNVSRTYTHSLNNGIYTVKREGTGNSKGTDNLEGWGTTKNGEEFTAKMLDAAFWNAGCSASHTTTGKLEIHIGAESFKQVVFLGVDNGGNASTSCPWGMKVEWSWRSKTKSELFPY